MSNTLDDSRLVVQARRGDRRAFDELVRRHRLRIEGLLLRLVRDRGEAENLCQDTFLKAYLALGRFEERSSFSTWLYRIATNLALNHLKRRERVVPWNDEIHGELLRAESSAEEVEQGEQLEALRAAVGTLPPRQRATLVLRTYEGLSFAEIAAILGCPIGTAKANHFHAVRNLRRRLLGGEGPSPQSMRSAAASLAERSE